MEEHVERVLKAAMELSEEDREVIGVTLLASLTKEEGYDEAWETEIQRRLEEMDSGRVEGSPWEEVQKKVREKLQAASDGAGTVFTVF